MLVVTNTTGAERRKARSQVSGLYKRSKTEVAPLAPLASNKVVKMEVVIYFHKGKSTAIDVFLEKI